MRLTGPCCVLLGVLCLLTGCQEPPVAPAVVAVPQEPTPMGGVGYLLFNTMITSKSRDLFAAALDKFHEAGASEIDIGISSPGGSIDAAQTMIGDMERLHRQGVMLKMYNVGLVASAATFVFLGAQDRYCAPRGAFLFHAAGMVSTGLVSAEILREQADKIEAYERIVRATLKARTKLTDSEAQTYLHRTVFLNSDDARRDGIVDGIAAFPAPKGAKTWVIASKPVKPGAAAAPTTKPPG